MRTPVTDLHCDTALEIQTGADLTSGNPEGHVDLERLDRGAVTLQVFASYVSSALPKGRAFRAAMDLLDGVEAACASSRGALVKVETAAEADRALLRGAKTAAFLAVENGHAIEESLTNLERLRLRGVRYMTLTHARNLPWAASSGEERCDFEGLAPFGEKVVAAMNEMGMIVDVSHVHETTLRDVTRLSRRPFIASHSDASALCPCARNLTDDQIRVIAGHGGLVGINFYPGFLDAAYAERQNAELGDLFATLEQVEREHLDDPVRKAEASRGLARTMRERMAKVRPPLDRIVDHVEHVVRLVGDDFVAFGSDFDGVPDLPEGVPDCAAFPAILDRMRERGLSEASIAKIAGANFRRVLESNP
ncbi:MAG: dipeptidase [Acidobacteriia bacterium]|nr:dipeptidase [Terriglobia bacterium]